MTPGKVHYLEDGPTDDVVKSVSRRVHNRVTARHKLMAVWLFVGVIPFILQVRSYLKFATPHKITQSLVVPSAVKKETTNLLEHCPVEGMLLSGSWFNIEPTHHYSTPLGRLCHFVLPQYNAHGNYMMGTSKVTPSSTTPTSCANDSFTLAQYFYHGSIGYYSFYEEQADTYCTNDRTAYIRGEALGSFDINGSPLAEDKGFEGYRISYWFCTGGAVWLVFRALVLRRCFVVSNRYARLCHELGEILSRKEAVVFVQENLRLIAHGATNYHRVIVLYLLNEGFMSDVFLLVANDGLPAKLQYASMGYNISALLLLVFEIIENLNCLREKWRLLIKRLLFSYETAFLGEIVSAAVQQELLTPLNRTRLRESRPTAVAISYYVWALVGHGIFVLNVIGFLVAVRVLFALLYVRFNHGTLSLFLVPCCVDTTLKLRNKMVMLGGYRWKNGKLLYTTSAMKAFGLQKMVEKDGTEFMALHKLHWFAVPIDNLFVIGVKVAEAVEPCGERTDTGVVSFFENDLGGDSSGGGVRHSCAIRVQSNVFADPNSLNVLPSLFNSSLRPNKVSIPCANRT